MKNDDIFQATKLNRYFKYHKVNTHLFELLSKGEFYYASHMELGDIFDLNLLEHISENFFKIPQEKVARQMFHDLRAGIFERYGQVCNHKLEPYGLDDEEKFLNGMNQLELTRDGKQELLKMTLQFGICCFTTDNKNNKMWDEYANKHTGICMEFDLTESPEIYEKIRPVTYHSSAIEINSINEIEKLLFSKKPEYEREQEWRHTTLFYKKFPFNKKCLKKIYFGVKTNLQEKQQVLNLIKTDSEYRLEAWYEGKIEFGILDFLPGH